MMRKCGNYFIVLFFALASCTAAWTQESHASPPFKTTPCNMNCRDKGTIVPVLRSPWLLQARMRKLWIARLGTTHYSRHVVDAARDTQIAKPAPDIILDAARGLNGSPSEAVVFEDPPAGVAVAHRAGVYVIGVGSAKNLPDADRVVPDLLHVDLSSLFRAATTSPG